MKYRDLIQFNPIESVVQLRYNDSDEVASQLVGTFVMSDSMAEKLAAIAIPQLQVEYSLDNKGLLIVGNYGTGKSHLMSVLSGIAANPLNLKEVKNEIVKAEGEKIAGKFKVIQTEIGAETISLRALLTSTIEEYLIGWGVNFKFPAINSDNSNKNMFEDMMTRFCEVYPDQGLLLVVDGLSDYLNSRNERDIVHDMNFLGELGDICKNSRFRLVTGIQESLLESPKSAFVAESLTKLNDQFAQIMITCDDMKYVVSEKMLVKSVEQQEKIRNHLQKFARFFDNLNENLEEFVQLFPIHPNYIDTFERVSVAERREIFKTLSLTIKQIMDTDVPEDEPGLIAFDNYWSFLKQEPNFRSEANQRLVVYCSEMLESRVENNFTRRYYVPMALRLIHALSVHRLTSNDVHNPLGMSVEEFRDHLLLFDPLFFQGEREKPEQELLAHIESVFQAIQHTVGGKIISLNDTNGQYSLDLSEVEDFDSNIEERAESLTDSQLNQYYFEALRRAMKCEDDTYISGHNIWQHELVWLEHNTTRPGYLFFGTPHERTAVVPNRDFYIYFIQPFGMNRELSNSINEKNSDEVFFQLDTSNDVSSEFVTSLKYFAASQESIAVTSGISKSNYESIANEHLRNVLLWLRENMSEIFNVTYQGQSKSIVKWVSGKPLRQTLGLSPYETVNFKDLVDGASSFCLAPHFKNQAPEYPIFPNLITENNREQAAQEALLAISGQHPTNRAVSVLEALKIFDGEKLNPSSSRYTKLLLELVNSKSEGQVTTRDQIMKKYNGLEYMAPDRFRLEPEWVVVLIAALVYSGEVILSVTGRKFDVTELEQLAETPLNKLIQFSNIEQIGNLNHSALKSLFEMLKIPLSKTDQIIKGSATSNLVPQLQKSTTEMVERITKSQQIITEGVTFLGQNLFENNVTESFSNEFNELKKFLESLDFYDTPDKLKNLQFSVAEIKAHENILKSLGCVESICEFVSTHGTLISWLSTAEEVLPNDHEWNIELKSTRTEILDLFKQVLTNGTINFHYINTKLLKLKEDYISAYTELHYKFRLNTEDDRRRESLTHDNRLQCLMKLASIDLMPKVQLVDFQTRLNNLKGCAEFLQKELDLNPICPHCGFMPIIEVGNDNVAKVIDNLDEELDSILEKWTKILLENLEDPTIFKNIKLVGGDAKKLLSDFSKSRKIKPPISDLFVNSLSEVFSDLIKVTADSQDIQNALQIEHGPMPPEVIRKRFNEFIAQLTKGKDSNKIRIMVE